MPLVPNHDTSTLVYCVDTQKQYVMQGNHPGNNPISRTNYTTFFPTMSGVHIRLHRALILIGLAKHCSIYQNISSLL